MIIQCPACNTSFSVSTEKFGTKNRKVKCSKCYFIWTANSQGKAIEVPPLYESINSQGGVIKENKNEKLDPNIKPCLLYTSPSPRDISGSRMPSSA